MAREYKDLKQEKSFAARIGIKQTVKIPIEEMDLKIREDRIGRYFKKYLNKFVFAEFSEEFLSTFKAADIMRGVPIPLRKQDIREFNGGSGLSMLHIAENMAWVIGCDPHFKYTQSYVDCMDRLYGKKICEGLLKEGRDAAELKDYDNACIHFRASLCMQPDYLHAMYSYARVCRVMYTSSKNREYVGRMKAESLDFFEFMVAVHPRHAQSYYYLGYAYLNMGQYIKARLVWNDFLRFSKNNKDKKEIRKRIEQIAKPVYIEEGCNDVMAGRFEDGIKKLETFLDDDYNKWWPLHYYLGVAYERCGRTDEAIERFKQVLKMNGSHLETMEELYAIYSSAGDEAGANKYRKKMAIIRKQLEEEAEAVAKDEERESTISGIEESAALDREYEKTPVEKIIQKGNEAQSKLDAIKKERAEAMDSELAEAMKKRKQEVAKGSRPTKRLK